MKKLISMTNFVLEKNKIMSHPTLFEEIVVDYAKFLKRPLTIGMFVPCDDDGNVLEEVLHIELYEGYTYDLDCKIYSEALSKVIFENISLDDACYILSQYENKTIEDITHFDIELKDTIKF